MLDQETSREPQIDILFSIFPLFSSFHKMGKLENFRNSNFLTCLVLQPLLYKSCCRMFFPSKVEKSSARKLGMSSKNRCEVLVI